MYHMSGLKLKLAGLNTFYLLLNGTEGAGATATNTRPPRATHSKQQKQNAQKST
jgi:hypothetical protein